MDQNQTVDNDLQKAIDDITNTTNTDPVFSDPVAAPSSVPEGDTGELGEPVGPFPEPKVEMVAPAPEPIAPFEKAPVEGLATDGRPLSKSPEVLEKMFAERLPLYLETADFTVEVDKDPEITVRRILGCVSL